MLAVIFRAIAASGEANEEYITQSTKLFGEVPVCTQTMWEEKERAVMEEQSQLFDICIVCALHEEARALIDEFSMRCRTSFTKAYHGLDHYEYRYATIQNRDKESLAVLVTWLPEMGPSAMAQEVKSLVQQFHPRFMSMTGICAGDQRKVHLGDLILASAAYHYEEGKVTSGPKGHQPATRMFSPPDQVLQYVRGFTDWEKPITQMKEQFLKQDVPATDLPKRFVAVMASGMAVRADDPFPWLQQQYHRQTVALDMEAASFYAALRSFTNALVVKGVCDYADMQKNDHYHDYAARISAVYLLHFIQEYVTEGTMPRRNTQARTRANQTIISSKPTNIRVSYAPSREGNKGIICFILRGAEHILEYIRYDNIFSDQIIFLKHEQQELVRLVVPFATLKSVEKHAGFQIDGVNGLLTFKMNAMTGIMNIKVEVGGVEVFHN